MADEADVFDKLEQVSIGTVVQVLRVLHELGRGDAPRPARSRKDGDGPRDVLFDVARLVLTGYEGFLRLQERYFDTVADGVRELGRPWTGGGQVARERLAIKGRIGELARGRFRLENEEDADVELTFRFGEFVAADDDRRFTPAVMVRLPGSDAARASDRRLAAGERRVFEVAVGLDPTLFQPRSRYVGDIHVVREGRTIGEVTVEVAVEAPANP